MDISFKLGTWIVPLLITIVIFVYAAWLGRDDTPSYGYGRIGDGVVAVFRFGTALIVSLMAWFVWVLMR